MAGCASTVPEVNASGDLFYGRFLSQTAVDFYWGRYPFSHEKEWTVPGWGYDQAWNMLLPLARAFNALYALTFSRGNAEESYDLPPLYWGSLWVYSNISKLRPVCDGGPFNAYTTDGDVELYLPWFYQTAVPERAAILVHEASHAHGWSHDAFFPPGSNRANPPGKGPQADAAWGDSAYSYHASWLADFAQSAISTTPAMRARAIFMANDIIDNCFATHPGFSIAGPRSYGFSPAAVSMTPGRIDLFAIGDDRGMWRDVSVAGPNWIGWLANTGAGAFSSGPAAVSMSPGRIDVFALGDDRDMWHNAWLGGPDWTGWTPDTGAGAFASGPAAESMDPNRVDLFALGDDLAMYHNVWDGGPDWIGWTADTGDGAFTSEPAAVSMSPGRLDVFALGMDRQMLHNAWFGTGWTGWVADTGVGTFSSGPAAVSMTPGRIDVFALGDDFRMWHNVWDGVTWSGWTDDTGEGTFASGPAAVSRAPGRIDLFGLGLDRRMWHNVWAGGPDWTGWTDDTGEGTFSGPQFPV